MPPRALPVSLSEYRSLLKTLWPDVPQRLGLAVSGGIDSMALSHLTRCLLEESRVCEVHAFIVDHGARRESSSEASSVAQILGSYGFKPLVISLTWGGGGVPKSGFETLARAARYRALANACLQARVDKLLLAHHADDQAETVMMRLISGSRADGLCGMKSLAPIPECWDIFHANRLAVGRPFLHVGKERLQATCESNAIQWFEDMTNHDITYTRRNTVRQLLNSAPSRLPRALQRDSLVALSSRAEERNRRNNEAALRLLRADCQIIVNERTGSVDFRLPEHREVLWKQVNPAVLQRMLVLIAEKASPAERVETRNMGTVFEKVLGAGNEDDVKTFTCVGLMWDYNGRQRWTLKREPFSTQRKSLSGLEVGPGLSKWILWDGRWWVRVETPPGCQCVIRVLESADMAVLRQKATEISPGLRFKFDAMLKGELKGVLRFTVPAIFLRREVEGNVEELFAALPTLGLRFQSGVKYEIRYKDR